MTQAEAPRDRDGIEDIYVGYRPMPARERRLLRWLVPMVLLTFWLAAGIWAGTFRSPGAGAWNADEPVSLEGLLLTRPYARVLVADPSAPVGVRTILLVREGKRGAAALARSLDGVPVRVNGTILQRDGRQLLELSPDQIEPVHPSRATPPRPATHPAGRVRLRGEIIDPKCFFGAMKPGEGKTHKECATLCIAGGIPPMFIVRAAGRAPTYYLLAGEGGDAVTEAVLPFVADPVEVTGQVEREGDLLVLRLDAGGIRRL